MTALVRHAISRTVALRLAAAVLPAVLAVALVIGLFYYGQYERAIPNVTLAIASTLTIISIIVAWSNARYFAERLARLARVTGRTSGERPATDEFDRIEQAVGNLGSALTAAEADRARANAVVQERLREQATMLAGVVSDSIAQLDQVRLPLQILLESPFGELNENQEELLRDARGAADAIDVALRRLAQVADADRDALPVQHELVQVNDVVRSVLPLARAAADRRGARTEMALEPGLPRVLGDRPRLAEALSLLVSDAAFETGPDTPLTVSTAREDRRTIIRITPRGERADGDASSVAADGSAPGKVEAKPARPGGFVLASRLIEAQGGEIRMGDGYLEVRVGQ